VLCRASSLLCRIATQAYQRPSSARFLVDILPDGSAVVFDTTTETVHSLNDTARRVWEACDVPATVAEIAAVLRDATGIDADASTIDDAVRQLVRQGLLVETVPVVSETSREASRSPRW
jgi:hypothetical protein